MKKAFCFPILAALSMLTTPASKAAAPLDNSECIVAAKPGGGLDLTCKLAQAALHEAQFVSSPMQLRYMPGGIGALAYNAIATQRPAEAGTIVAFSSGSLLNIAQGKFGKLTAKDVRWMAAVATDFGAMVVRKDSPFKTLGDLAEALKADPKKVVFGAGGTVGSQDWMKAALTARAAGISHKAMRFVAFDGGGEGISALQGRHVHVYSGDAAEAVLHIKAGADIRILAVLSDKRLPGDLSSVPTAKEQGYDVEWPVIRGFYMGPKVSDADFQAWSSAFEKLLRTKAFAKQVERSGFYPLSITGAELDAYIDRTIQNYRRLAHDFGLVSER